jgi:FlaG/FlaF family flagellin (archaellin)
MLKTILLVLAVLLPTVAVAEPMRVSDDYALAALRAVVHARTFGTATEISAKEWEFINEADVQATTEAELQSLERLKTVIFGPWSVNHSGAQVQACYAALKIALKKRDGATPEACK